MKKKWFENLDFYEMSSLLCLWTASWLFMMPFKVMVENPYYDNFWGSFIAFFGSVSRENASIQNLPDLLSGLIALVVMFIMQIRGFYSLSLYKDESGQSVFECLTGLFSVLVHTLFFTVIIKVFLFPDMGLGAMPFTERLKENFWLSMFGVFCVTGMILGVRSLAKVLFMLLVFISIGKNIVFVSQMMGVTGFIAVLFCVAAFYFDFKGGTMNFSTLVTDFKILSGNYKDLMKGASEESVKVREKTGSVLKTINESLKKKRELKELKELKERKMSGKGEEDD